MKTIKLPPAVTTSLEQISRYRILAFILFVVALYGYAVFQINQAMNIEPDTTTVTPTPTAHVDPTVVAQLKQLQDNSVSVKALFNQTRTDPFQ